MKIIAHRGFWQKIEEKNTLTAIKRAFKNGFGIETDVRDYNGELVISHNIANETCFTLEDVFKIYQELKTDVDLAINIKADGLQELLKNLIVKYNIKNYYLFDMSIPEMVVNEREGLKFLTRNSDIESLPVLYEKANGVWLDAFYDLNWLSIDKILKHIRNNKVVFIVSPELHGQAYNEFWNTLKQNNIHLMDKVFLCTDMLEKAEEFFYGKN